ncbi:hypothetical protein QF028_002293 [Neobacillus sp. B4I6]|uniref:hypothetical protein n=1 Tax=Neobacillus sp. B4I6 TaxID=3373925 RepID=UPI003D2509D3
MDYYPFVFIINKKEYYCAWYSNDRDGFLTECNKIKVFNTKDLLFDYAKESNIQFNDEEGIARFSIDYALNWLKDKNLDIDCDYFLNFWNNISDLAYSVGENFYGDLKKAQINKVYDKLFFGNNLPAITPKNKNYYPTWDTAEKIILVKMVQDGIRIIDVCL